MAARQTKTPGATEAPKTIAAEVPAATTTQQADDVLDEILGVPVSKDADTSVSTEATGTASEPVKAEPTAEELQAKKEYEEFLEWRNNKAAAPVAQHVPAFGVASEPVAKRTRPVLGPDGWTSEEY